jgi:chemotaxis protein CheD
MAGNFHHVHLGHMAISANPADTLGIYGLGSCVAVLMYDPAAHIGGILHALLPAQARDTSSVSALPTKFVDQGIHRLLADLCTAGAEKARLQVYLCGGAHVVAAADYSDVFNIGQRNIETAQKVLKETGLKVQAQAVGGTKGRTVKFYIFDGRITVKTLGEVEKTLTPRPPLRRTQ